MENPFEAINNRLANIETLLLRILDSRNISTHRTYEDIEATFGLETEIREIALSVRLYNLLKYMEVRTIKDLLDIDEMESVSVRGFGEAARGELRKVKLRFKHLL